MIASLHALSTLVGSMFDDGPAHLISDSFRSLKNNHGKWLINFQKIPSARSRRTIENQVELPSASRKCHGNVTRPRPAAADCD